MVSFSRDSLMTAEVPSTFAAHLDYGEMDLRLPSEREGCHRDQSEMYDAG